MRELVEAAVATAGRTGVQAAVIIVGGGNGNGHAPAAPVAGAADADTVARYNAALGRIQALEAETKQKDGALHALTAERDSLSTRVREGEAKILSLQAGGAPATPSTAPGTVAPQGGSIDGQSIDILGIEEEIAKKLKKKEWETVGKLRAALLEGKLTSEAKIPKDGVIAVSWALLGKTPPATLPAGAPATGSPSAPTQGADVPAGLTDRPWKERLAAARKKERDKKAIEVKLASLTAQMNGTADPTARGQIQAQITNDKGTHDVLGGQVFCLLWSCGLCAPGTFKSVADVSVDAALTQAGLAHLVETPATVGQAPAPATPPPPPPQGAPAPAAPPATPPAPPQ